MREDIVTWTADQLLAARRGEASLVQALDDKGPADLAEAYAVQSRVANLFDAKIGAWKVGGPLSGQPMMAPIYQADICASPARLAATHDVGIECEIAFLLGEDLPAREAVYDEAEVGRAIAAVLPLIETVWARIDDFMSAPVYWKLADNQANGGLVLGEPQSKWTPAMWQETAIRLMADGREVKFATGSNPGGDSLGLLTWLANHVGDRLGGLKAGQIVTTGSYTGMDMFVPGTEIQADFGPLGCIEIKI